MEEARINVVAQQFESSVLLSKGVHIPEQTLREDKRMV